MTSLIRSTFTDNAPRFSAALVLTLLLVAVAPTRTASADALKLTYNSEWPPYSFGSRERVKGILPDLVDAIAAGDPALGIKNHGQAWATVERTIRRSQRDAFVTTPTEKRLAFTKASADIVYTIEFVPMVRKGGRTANKLAKDLLGGLKSVKICGIKGNGWEENFYGAQGLRYRKAKNSSRCMARLVDGSSDVIIQSKAVALKLINDAGLGDRLTVLPNAAAKVGFKLMIRNTHDGADAWLKAFDARLAAMKASGAYQRAVDEATARYTAGSAN